MRLEDFARSPVGRFLLPVPKGLISACAALAFALACNIDNPGDEPPRGVLYFPNAMVLSKHPDGSPPRYLFVANSNFDLRYSHGTIQAYSLDRLSAKVDRCRAPNTVCQIEPSAVLDDEIRITGFCTAIGLSSDGSYLFAATRTDSSLIFVHVDAEAARPSDVLKCKGDEITCSLRGLRLVDSQGTDRKQLSWPPDPEALVAGPLSDWQSDQESPVEGDFVLVAHTGVNRNGVPEGAVSLFVLQPNQRDKPGELTLASALTGLGGALPGISYDAVTRYAYMPLAASGAPKLLIRIGVAVTTQANGAVDLDATRPYFVDELFLDGAAPFSDTRDVAFIPPLPDAGAAFAQNRALIVSQQPSALLVTDIDQTRNTPGAAQVKATAVVGPGATRVVVGDFGGHPLAVVGSFGSRELSVIELSTMLPRAVVPNLSGPYALALDEERRLLYVDDFRSSVIRIIDLAPALDPESTETVRIVATLGKPRVLQELR